MYPLHRWIVSAGLALAMCLALPVSAPAKSSAWKDAQGTAFRGEPVEILGPFALFRTSGGGRRVLLRAFSPEECRRIQAEIASLPPRAESLAQAKGEATGALAGNVLRLRDKTLVPADLASLPEPELLLVLCGSHNDGESWGMVGNMSVLYGRVQRVFPGLMEAVFLGTRHNLSEHREIAPPVFHALARRRFQPGGENEEPHPFYHPRGHQHGPGLARRRAAAGRTRD